MTGAALEAAQHQHNQTNGYSGLMNGSVATTVGGILAHSNTQINGMRGQHNRAVSLPVFPQGQQGQQQHSGFMGMASGLGQLNGHGYGLAIQNEGGLPGWAEEEIGAQ